MEEAALPLMLDAMWAANVMDIDSTVKSVCHRVDLTSINLKSNCSISAIHSRLPIFGQNLMITFELSELSRFENYSLLALTLYTVSLKKSQDHDYRSHQQMWILTLTYICLPYCFYLLSRRVASAFKMSPLFSLKLLFSESLFPKLLGCYALHRALLHNHVHI